MASGSSLLILPRGKDHAAPLFHPLTSRTCARYRHSSFSFQDAPPPSKGQLTLSHHSLIKTAPHTGTRSLYCMNEVHIRACWGTRSCKRGHDLNMRSEKALRL